MCQNEMLPLVLKVDSGSRLTPGTLCPCIPFPPYIVIAVHRGKMGSGFLPFLCWVPQATGSLCVWPRIIPCPTHLWQLLQKKASGDGAEGGRGVLEVISTSPPGMVESKGSKGPLGLVALVVVMNQ